MRLHNVSYIYDIAHVFHTVENDFPIEQYGTLGEDFFK